MKKVLGCGVLVLALVGAASNAAAEDEAARNRRKSWRERVEFLKLRGILKLESVVITGDPSKRVDIVILSDCYKRENLGEYKAKSDNIARQLVHLQPFENFRNYINFHRLYIESPGGAEEPVLGSTVDAGRILTCDRTKVEDMARYAPDCDLMLVVSRTKKYARSTAEGNLITLCSKTGVTRTTVHELGHAFGGLADEYVECCRVRANMPPPEVEPEQVNVTLEPEPLLCKWHYWVRQPKSGHKPSNREGALYVKKGVYRPEANCTMRHGGGFCVVCLEQMVRRFFKYIHPIDEQFPKTVKVVMCNDEKKEFTAKALAYEATGSALRAIVNWRWYVDNEPVQATRSKSAATYYGLDGATIDPGLHEIVVSGDLRDTRVRRDFGMMSDARFWRVEVLPYPRPVLWAPERRAVHFGEEVSFDVKIENIEPGNFTIKTVGLPKGATFDPTTGAFTWTPGKDQTGAHLIDFVAGNDKVEEAVQTLIVVGKGTGHNKPPDLEDALDENGFEGRPFNFTLNATDPDGDALLFDVSGLPDEAKLDRRTGEVTWSPGYMDSGKYYVVAQVTDGIKTSTARIILIVDNVPVQADKIDSLFADDRNFDFCIPIRLPDANCRLRGLGRLKDTPLPFRAAHVARFLRDIDEFVREEAANIVKAEKDNKEFRTCFLREMAGKLWQLSDEDDMLAILRKDIDRSRQEEWSSLLKRAITVLNRDLTEAERYNKYRAAFRAKVEIERAKKAAKDVEAEGVNR